MIRAAGARFGVGDDDIDTLMQDVRIRLWRSRGESEEIAALPTSYVYRTAMAAAVDLVRTRRRGDGRSVSLDSIETLAARGETDAALLASDLGAAVARALEDLVEARRIVVRLHLSGYERAEIVELLGWSNAKVRNLLYRGLQDLRERLVRAGYRWPDDG
jgi:RNA polymerase sigma factor (sigma-70 family)